MIHLLDNALLDNTLLISALLAHYETDTDGYVFAQMG